MDRRPNILFLMTDQQRYDQLGRTNPALKTPHLDALAGESVFFTRAYTSNPVCIPARAAIMTGRYPGQTGVHHNGLRLPPTERTVMSMLREGGYYTAVIGKQHFAGSAIEHGYDYEDIIDSHGPAREINPEADARGRGDDSYQRFLFANGFRHSSELLQPVDNVVNRWLVDERFHVDHFVGSQAVAWMDGQLPADRPWFVCVSFPGPHGPVCEHGTTYEERIDPDSIDLPRTDLSVLDAKPPHYHRQPIRGGRDIREPLDVEQIRRIRRSWYANLALIDDQVGAVLDCLRRSGQYDHTLIVYTTDHGDFTCDYNLVDKGQFLLDVLMHIPLMVKPPVAGFAGKEESSLVSTVDLAATWLTAAGLPVPGNMRSRDLSAYWQDPADRDDRELVYLDAQDVRGIRTRRWKLIHYQGDSQGELYDLEHDPWETRNLWDAPEHQSLKAGLTRQLLDQVMDLATDSRVAWSTSPRPPAQS